MLEYHTSDGDVVDEIIWHHYGVLNAAMLRQVLEANPGLADLGDVLPAGVVVALPDIDQPSNVTVPVALWN